MIEELQSNSQAVFLKSQALVAGREIELPSNPNFTQTSYTKENMAHIRRAMMLPLITRERENKLALAKLSISESLQQSR